ncbi:MAG: type II toxin-antitoxin system Phd/YefM family antitoxin [Byssovorax sp.]
MRSVRISEDIVPVSDFKAQAADWLRRVAETGHPLVITQNGKAAGVLLSPAEFDRLNERAQFVSAVEEGLADADAGRLSDHDDVAARMRTRTGAKRAQ